MMTYRLTAGPPGHPRALTPDARKHRGAAQNARARHEHPQFVSSRLRTLIQQIPSEDWAHRFSAPQIEITGNRFWPHRLRSLSRQTLSPLALRVSVARRGGLEMVSP